MALDPALAAHDTRADLIMRMRAEVSGARHRRVVGAVDISFGAAAGDLARRDTAHGRVRGYIADDHGVGSNGHVITDMDTPDHHGTRCDIDIVADDRAAGALTAIQLPERDSV